MRMNCEMNHDYDMKVDAGMVVLVFHEDVFFRTWSTPFGIIFIDRAIMPLSQTFSNLEINH